MSQEPELRVLVVADDHLARAGLATLLAEQPECVIAGQISSGAELLAMLETYQPDVIVWDLGWHPTVGMERLADLDEIDIPVVALLPDETYAAGARTSGARGLLLRNSDASTLVAALIAVAQGLIVLDPKLPVQVPPSRDQSPSPIVGGLTPREMEVLALIAEGLPNKSIAHQLSISEHTVKFHVNAIMGKLCAQSRTEAVTRATRMGLILL